MGWVGWVFCYLLCWVGLMGRVAFIGYMLLDCLLRLAYCGRFVEFRCGLIWLGVLTVCSYCDFLSLKFPLLLYVILGLGLGLLDCGGFCLVGCLYCWVGCFTRCLCWCLALGFKWATR